MGFALEDDSVRLFLPPPTRSWEEVLRGVKTLDELDKAISEFNRETTEWLARLRRSYDDGTAKIRHSASRVSVAEAGVILLPIIDEGLRHCLETIESHSTPFHEQNSALVTFEKLRRVSGPTGRFVRKLINRAEDIRIRRYNGIVDLYNAMLEFRSEFVASTEIEGDDFDRLSLQIATEFNVVNAYLAR